MADALCNVDEMHFRCDNTTDPAIPILKILLAIDAREAAIDILQRNHGILAGSSEGREVMAEAIQRLGITQEVIVAA